MTEDPPVTTAHAHAVVIGAGLGGLAAAIELAAAGHRVTVVEAQEQPGGKAGTVALPGGVVADTGPSVLTIPELLEPLLAHAGMQVGVDLVLRQPEPVQHHRKDDRAGAACPRARGCAACCWLGPLRGRQSNCLQHVGSDGHLHNG